MPAAVYLLVLGALTLAPRGVLAQEPGPPGPYVVDLHAAITMLPQDPAFFPTFPSGTAIPTRSLGLDLGAHVYPLSIGPARLGIGVSLLRVGGSASPERPSSSSTSAAAAPPRPDVDTSVTAIAPQLSLNFGSADGWSYVSAGIGQAHVETRTSAFSAGSGTSAVVRPERSVSMRSLRSLNVGGGARWFTRTRLAFSFDIRVHLVAAGSREERSTPPTTVVAVAGGISVR